ncbi:MAG: MerR family transcriptional regulator [Acidimicrobiia bacterium]
MTTDSEQTNRENLSEESKPLRMADLVKATDVPKSTILYYVSEGLLPEPERPKPNVAYYDPICVDLIRYIRGAQRIHRYPLSLIRTNVKHILGGASGEQILQLGQRLLGEPTEMYTQSEVAEQVGIDETQVKHLVDLGLVWPTADGTFDNYDLRMVELLTRAENVGLPSESFVAVAEAVRQVEEAAATIVREHVSTPMGTQQTSVLIDVLGRMQPYLVRRYFESRDVVTKREG